ncbi:hypothetical protein ACQ3I4_11870 [Zafaria sp. Z1313]|uniref:hypothetical protein n=1 Tax=unclassified Zafaria TaxID=2828765 RepID=UPI002E75DD99|nr:hypothetical protein [Zafaria sp. J156]MEE1622028.1 hypothetical protein [Zafaria sp. J156]
MITAQKFRGRRTAAALALGLMAVGVTGCGAINAQATAESYAPSDGIVFNAGDLKIRNLMLVTNTADEEARVLGSLVNTTDQDQTLVLEVAGSSVTIDIPAQSTKKLEDDVNKTILPSAGAEPGAHVDASVNVGGASESKSVPVVNGALAEYRPYLPGGYDESTVEHLAPAEEEHGSGH